MEVLSLCPLKPVHLATFSSSAGAHEKPASKHQIYSPPECPCFPVNISFLLLIKIVIAMFCMSGMLYMYVYMLTYVSAHVC